MIHDNLVHEFIPTPQAMKIPDVERKKLETTPAWQLKEVTSKKEIILEAHRDKEKVHFASPMDTCHVKNAELEPALQKYRGQVVLRGDIVKVDSGAYACFSEQGSLASHMSEYPPAPK